MPNANVATPRPRQRTLGIQQVIGTMHHPLLHRQAGWKKEGQPYAQGLPRVPKTRRGLGPDETADPETCVQTRTCTRRHCPRSCSTTTHGTFESPDRTHTEQQRKWVPRAERVIDDPKGASNKQGAKEDHPPGQLGC